MKYIIILFILAASLSGCSNDDNYSAVKCRNGIRQGSYTRINAIISVKTDAPAISYLPLKCKNMEFTFKSDQANKYAAIIANKAQSLPGGYATFKLDALGVVSFNEKLEIPRMEIVEVKSFSQVY